MKTRQQLFDLMYLHVVKQGKPSMSMIDGAQGCAYRGDGGLKCAYGILIPDDVYDPEMEGKGSNYLSFVAAHRETCWGVRYLEWLRSEINSEDIDFVREMQRCHDEAGKANDGDFVCHFKREAAYVAKVFEVVIPEVVA